MNLCLRKNNTSLILITYLVKEVKTLLTLTIPAITQLFDIGFEQMRNHFVPNKMFKFYIR